MAQSNVWIGLVLIGLSLLAVAVDLAAAGVERSDYWSPQSVWLVARP